MKHSKMKSFLLAILCLSFTTFVSGQDKPELKQKETAAFAERMAAIPDGGVTGEDLAWYLNADLGPILRNCQTGSDDWMSPAESVLNMLANKMAVGPDGYKGFVGSYGYNREHWCDVHVGDAILVARMLQFAMIVHDNPTLKAKYGKSAQRFIDIAKKDLIEKWEKRGTLVIDGPFAGYKEWNMYCKSGDLKNWYRNDAGRGINNPVPSLPFNKSIDMAHCMLLIYLMTGEKMYKDTAEKIYNRVKAGMNPFKGGYTWNYWEPIFPGDIYVNSRNQQDLSHWVDTHPYRNYQSGEVDYIVFAYHMGVTFTEADIRRLVNTNLLFMWNGDKEEPKWVNSNSRLPGYRQASPSEAYPTWAGALWSSITQFDATLCSLANSARRNRDSNSEPAPCRESFVRKYAPNAVVQEPIWMKDIKESAGQVEAIVIPSVVDVGESTVILSKALAPMSPVEICVRLLNGSDVVTLATQQMGEGRQLFYVWDGKINGRRTLGEYVIIWKYMGGERAYPVTLK